MSKKSVPPEGKGSKQRRTLAGSPSTNCCALRVLRLTLKKKWFDMIASGEKREEYRNSSKWIQARLEGREYDIIEFKNGYGANVPTMTVEYQGYIHAVGKPEWGGNGERVIVICLGRVLSLQNDLAHTQKGWERGPDSTQD